MFITAGRMLLAPAVVEAASLAREVERGGHDFHPCACFLGRKSCTARNSSGLERSGWLGIERRSPRSCGKRKSTNHTQNFCHGCALHEFGRWLCFPRWMHPETSSVGWSPPVAFHICTSVRCLCRLPFSISNLQISRVTYRGRSPDSGLCETTARCFLRRNTSQVRGSGVTSSEQAGDGSG